MDDRTPVLPYSTYNAIPVFVEPAAATPLLLTEAGDFLTDEIGNFLQVEV